MTEHSVRIFVNGRGFDAPAGSTALDAVALHSTADAAGIADCSLLITDSRGIAVPPDAALYNGAIFRLIPNRGRDGGDPAARFDD